MRTALYPGSFDPFHNGHLEVVEQAARLFDEVVVAAMVNPGKAGSLFSLDERQKMIVASVSHLRNVRIASFEGLTVDAARDLGAALIVKGLRTTSDFESEMQMAQMNHSLSGIRTVFVPTAAGSSFVASSLLREITRLGGDVSHLVPSPVASALMGKAR